MVYRCVKVLSDGELQRFLVDPLACAGSPWLMRIVTLLPGTRAASLMQARWFDIDRAEQPWTIPAHRQ
jgi:hypothetical protein